MEEQKRRRRTAEDPREKTGGRRLYVEKRPEFRIEADNLRQELNEVLGLDLSGLRLINIYDLFGFDDVLYEESLHRVFADPVTDLLLPPEEIETIASGADRGRYAIAVEYLPGQFDPRATSAEDCVRLIRPDARIHIRSGRLMVVEGVLAPDAIERIENYLVNPVDSRRKDLGTLKQPEPPETSPDRILEGFREVDAAGAGAYCADRGLAMSATDLMTVVEYFRREGRDPSETELKILDTYWSDHCRHTTFNTSLDEITIEPSAYSEEIESALDLWRRLRHDLNSDNDPLTLMELATIGKRHIMASGLAPDVVESGESNAAGIRVKARVDGREEDWVLQIKNETHNHPTEIEPFGGAATCIGGVVRDPLSGRTPVFQAARVTGAGDVFQPVEETLAGKLPQRVISRQAAAGFSAYANRLGIPTTLVREYCHPGYVAKRLEAGVVVGGARADTLRYENPRPGDVVMLIGGRTGRDGIGGATGSSKSHTQQSLAECGSEVQKGNPVEERKMQRLFRNPEVVGMIKRANDFGAGGVSVAVGELADSMDIWLDRVPVKYEGLSALELAVSESQERMAVVIDAEDRQKFTALCNQENIEATCIAEVTASGRLRMMRGGKVVADLRREFLDSAGAPRSARAVIQSPEVTLQGNPDGGNAPGMAEMFDSTIGAGTVLMPFGGATQRTETQASVVKLPAGNSRCDTASLLTFGFDPWISQQSPYHGAAYAIAEALAKAVGAGARYDRVRFSFQEYFRKLDTPQAWGQPLAALLGALRMQESLGLPAIGGKDSMSGTFGELHVPPGFIAFALAPVDVRTVISPEFKRTDSRLYLLRIPLTKALMPDTGVMKTAYEDLHRRIADGTVISAFALQSGGVAEAAGKMALGNEIGAAIRTDDPRLFGRQYGSILLESRSELPEDIYTYVGTTTERREVDINGVKTPIEQIYREMTQRMERLYPMTTEAAGEVENASSGPNSSRWEGAPVGRPRVFIPVFPGTNCDCDMAEAFEREGADVVVKVFRNLTPADVEQSIREMTEEIDLCHILALSGGFSAGDEPDGSGKYIANVLMNSEVKGAIRRLMSRRGLIIGICNGFQALLKSGLLPYGETGKISRESATLVRNDINRHVSRAVTTRVASVASPWLEGLAAGELFTVASSHTEGKFVASEEEIRRLAAAGQIAFQYADPLSGNATMKFPLNPNGSMLAIEGLISPDGLILGKMTHPERYREDTMINVSGNKRLPIFRNGVDYFRTGAYSAAGVDLDAAGEVVEKIRPIAAATRRPGVKGGVGAFGAMFDIGSLGYRHPVLVSATDGVGTKLMLAREMNRYDTIGIDLVAMNVNDILTHGADPLYFLDYIATGRLDPPTVASIVAGIAEGCRQAGCALVGGETAEMPGMYGGGDFDLAGFATGAAEADAIVDGSAIEEGDLLIALPSSGVHSNGFSLIRKIIADRHLDLRRKYNALNSEKTLGEILLTPTAIYVTPIRRLMRKIKVRGMAHITGGGLPGNLPRVLPEGLATEIFENSWDIPEIFRFIEREGAISRREMMRAFNMGIGMIVAVASGDASEAVETLKAAGADAWVAGRVVREGICGEKERVRFR